MADLNTRLAFYQRLAKLDSPEQVKDMRQELKDRFGEMPPPVQNLLYVIRIRLLSAEAGIQKISTEGKQIVLMVGKETEIDRASLQHSLGSSVKVVGDDLYVVP